MSEPTVLDAGIPTATTGTPPDAGIPAATTGTPPDTGVPAVATGTPPDAGIPAVNTPAKPEDWASTRERYSKGDAKVLAKLSRYSSQDAVIDALLAAQTKITAGGLKEPLPDKPTPEQLAAWRADNGIPSAPSDYEVAIPEGMDLSEEGQANITGLLEAAHGANLTAKQVEATLGYLWKVQEAKLESDRTRDAATLKSATDAMSTEWGSEYGLNKNLIVGILERGGEDVRNGILGARLADGTPLGNHPGVLRWLANIAREIDPTPTLTPGSGMSSLEGVGSRLTTIQSLMGDQTSKYWKGPEAKGLQDEFLRLTEKQRVLKR